MQFNYITDVFDDLQHSCNITGIVTVLDDYSFDLQDLINFCGGVPLDTVSNFKLIAVKNTYCSIEVSITCEEYRTTRLINFEGRYILNQTMYVTEPGNYIGTTLFLNQVAACKDRFNYLRTYAVGDFDSYFTGYAKWGRVGYFQDPDDHRDFLDWASTEGINAKSLHEYLEDDYNYEVWKLKGKPWSGYFNLNDNSPNMNYLRDYLRRKGIRFKI